MRFRYAIPFTVIAVALLLGCPPAPPPAPPTPFDGGDAAPAPPPPPIVIDAAPPAPPPPPASQACIDACKALAKAGCTEGESPRCPAAMQTVNDMRIIRAPSGAVVTCAAVSKVTSQAEAEAAGVGCSLK